MLLTLSVLTINFFLSQLSVGDILWIPAFVRDSFPLMPRIVHSMLLVKRFVQSLCRICYISVFKLNQNHWFNANHNPGLLPAVFLLLQLSIVKFELVIENFDTPLLAIILLWCQQVPAVFVPTEQQISVGSWLSVQHVLTEGTYWTWNHTKIIT